MDFIIVGGGLIGMLSALELTAAGAKVRLLERGTIGREASWAGGGILSPLYPWRCSPALTALARWSQDYYPGLADMLLSETGVDSEWIRCGLLVLEDNERKEATRWAKKNRYVLEVLDRKAIHSAEPGLSHIPERALLMPEIAQIRNPELMKALKIYAEKQGIQLDEHTVVEGIKTEEGRVSGVVTRQEEIAGKNVLVASGAWSGKLLREIGVGLDIVPVRGQMLLFNVPPGLVKHIILCDGYYLIPRKDGRVIIGSTVEYVGFDKATTEIAHRELVSRIVELLPALSQHKVEKHWAGLRPGSKSGIPFIGRVPGVEGLYVNAGHFRNGVGIGPASARLLADIVMQRTPCVDPRPYAIDRS